MLRPEKTSCLLFLLLILSAQEYALSYEVSAEGGSATNRKKSGLGGKKPDLASAWYPAGGFLKQ